MADTFRNIGTLLGVSATLPTTFDDNVSTGYPSLTFTNVEGVGSVGEFGKSYEVLNFTDLADGEVQKDYGSLNVGDPVVQYRTVPSDAGQSILKTAQDGLAKIAIKVSRPDGLIQYAIAIVATDSFSEASAANTKMRSTTLGLTNLYEDDSAV